MRGAMGVCLSSLRRSRLHTLRPAEQPDGRIDGHGGGAEVGSKRPIEVRALNLESPALMLLELLGSLGSVAGCAWAVTVSLSLSEWQSERLQNQA